MKYFVSIIGIIFMLGACDLTTEEWWEINQGLSSINQALDEQVQKKRWREYERAQRQHQLDTNLLLHRTDPRFQRLNIYRAHPYQLPCYLPPC